MSADIPGWSDENYTTITDLRKLWEKIAEISVDNEGTIKEWQTPNGRYLEILDADGRTKQLVKIEKHQPEIISFVRD